MPIIKSFMGLESYKDKKATEDVLSYAVNSPYAVMSCSTNLLMPYDLACVIQQYHNVQNTNNRAKINLNHFVIGLEDVYLRENTLEEIMTVTKNYFKKLHIQAYLVTHYRSDTKQLYPHIHVVLNHVSTDGTVAFYGRDVDYYNLKYYLEKAFPGYQWQYKWANKEDYEIPLS